MIIWIIVHKYLMSQYESRGSGLPGGPFCGLLPPSPPPPKKRYLAISPQNIIQKVHPLPPNLLPPPKKKIKKGENLQEALMLYL